VALSANLSFSAAASSSGFASFTRAAEESLSSSSDEESEWGEDEWPSDHPLPLPLYGCERPELSFSTLEEYEALRVLVTDTLEEATRALPYDSVSNFFQFAQEYLAEEADYSSLREFFRDYDLPVLQGRNTCVGLVADLLSRLSVLEQQYPGIKDSLYMVSCEEWVENVDWYCSGSSPPLGSCEKEHVMLCGRIKIEGRRGVILMDPGYHVALPITVMEDGQYPQSQPYRAVNGPTHKTYSYKFHEKNPMYVEWDATKEGKTITSVVFVHKPFLTGLDVAERRNLAWPLKILTSRFANGDIRSGLYFPVKKGCQVTFFVNSDSGESSKIKIPISYFRNTSKNWYGDSDRYYKNESSCQPLIFYENQNINQIEESKHFESKEEWDEIITKVALEVQRPNEIGMVLNNVSYFLENDGFVEQVLQLNAEINEFSDMN